MPAMATFSDSSCLFVIIRLLRELFAENVFQALYSLLSLIKMLLNDQLHDISAEIYTIQHVFANLNWVHTQERHSRKLELYTDMYTEVCIVCLGMHLKAFFIYFIIIIFHNFKV